MTEEKRMIELHRKHNEKYERYKKLHPLILKLDLFEKVSIEDLEEIDRRLKVLDRIINEVQNWKHKSDGLKHLYKRHIQELIEQ
ncbi:MAG: hypothetical protein GPJ51_06545 [Candidatus Heimdallarchaeota archaeon]|nr:hypothetical protein [Candidatus Heimdallarchaeota archaeon]